MIGQTAIAIALPGFSGLGRWVAPTLVSFLNQILFTIISTLSKNEQKIKVDVKKIFKISVHGTSNPAILRLQGA